MPAPTGHALYGALAAFASSCTWAFASARYAQVSRDIGSTRVNLSRAVFVVPIYVALVAITSRAHALDGVTPSGVLWLFASVICSYGFADNLFFASARRLGVSTALSIASTYPLWAALTGVLSSGERFGPVRASGTLLCVGGVIALVRLSPAARDGQGRPHRDVLGFALAFLTSLLWAGNSVSIKRGAVGLTVFQANALRYSMALLLLGTTVALSRTRPPASRPMGGWRRLVPAIVADAVFGSILYVYGLSHTDLATGATLSSQAPLISVPVAILLGEERWNAKRFAAVTATVAGIALLLVAA
jgi:drug/metabolite transporter (DMT)-like permease